MSHRARWTANAFTVAGAGLLLAAAMMLFSGQHPQWWSLMAFGSMLAFVVAQSWQGCHG